MDGELMVKARGRSEIQDLKFLKNLDILGLCEGKFSGEGGENFFENKQE